ncbi:MAG: hypothetical protein Q8P41_08210 [Pseudomonadota bacterium]|nr:hypothetical protein [Pseudomonadota bacterium]
MLRPVLVLFLLLGLACGPASTRQHARIEQKIDRVDEKIDRMMVLQEATREGIEELVALARRQGTGEITLFFPWNSDSITRGSAQYRRLVTFLDRLAFESRGRTVRLVSVGSAGDWWRSDWNDGLSARRAEAPRWIVKQHLLYVPHTWSEVYGIGAREAPAEHLGRTWRHVRIIAVYDDAQLPALPARPSP